MMFMKAYWKGVRNRLKAGLVRVGYHSTPKYLIIGAQKCGTTALFSYLSKHPNIIPASEKEIHFFDRDIAYNKGTAWYHSHFPLPHKLRRDTITFEASPAYLYCPRSARRIFSYDPQIKLIVLLRDPVDRAYSAWNMYRHRFHKNSQYLFENSRDPNEDAQEWIDEMLSSDSVHTFDEAIRNEIDKILAGDSSSEPSYVRRGLYYEQLLQYFKYFECDQILILDSRSLKRNTSLVLREVLQFLGLPEYDWRQIELSLVHVRKYEEQMPTTTRVYLSEFYKPYNERLYELLDHDFGWQ